MVIVAALKRHLFCIQSEKIAPEGYPSISSINFIKEYEVCDVWISVPEEGKRPMRNLKAFVKTHLPDIFLQLLLYKVYKCKYWKNDQNQPDVLYSAGYQFLVCSLSVWDPWKML